MHGIKIATLRSGLTSHVIRTWEKRYKAVQPVRTETNRRQYSDKNIQRLVWLADLTKNGHAISNIAHLSDEELASLHESLKTSNPENTCAEIAYEPVIAKTLEAIRNFDQCSLETIFDKIVKESGYSFLLEKVLIPFISRVGILWHEGDITTAEEHAATSFIKDYLCISARPFNLAINAPKLLITTPQGQLHELGATIAAAQARKFGWRVVYLGTSLPPDEIAGAAEKIGARAVVLSIISPLDDPQINVHLRKLRSQLDKQIPIIIGGPNSKMYGPTLDELKITQLKTLADLSPVLGILRK
ncbi:MAG: cobalamin-dependent protein [Rubritalea sp.]|uniref:MerR family transcriptional regulator n=1 Tax=Rubritalea sp. TaxID=2109375 RepID=UPI003242297E